MLQDLLFQLLIRYLKPPEINKLNLLKIAMRSIMVNFIFIYLKILENEVHFFKFLTSNYAFEKYFFKNNSIEIII